MIDMRLSVSLDDLLRAINQLDPEQKRMVRQQLDDDWAVRFGQAIDAIRADIPSGISADEVEADIEQAIREVRDQS